MFIQSLTNICRDNGRSTELSILCLPQPAKRATQRHSIA